VPRQKITVAEKQTEIETLSASLKEQASQIHKLSPQLRHSESAPWRT